MVDKPPKWSLQSPHPVLDKSKWAKVEKAKPIDPRDIIEAARVVRANPELWAIFERLNADDWISWEDSARIKQFYQRHLSQLGRGENVYLMGQEKVLLRSLREGLIDSLDNDEELLVFLKFSHPATDRVRGRHDQC